MLDKVINMIINNSGENKSIVKEIFDDCLRLCASNDEKYQSVINNDAPINEDLLKSLIEGDLNLFFPKCYTTSLLSNLNLINQ